MHDFKTLSIVVIVGIFFLSISSSAARAEAEPVVLQAGRLTASLAAADGRLLSLAVGQHELLASPGVLTLQVDKGTPAALGTNLEGFTITRSRGGLIVEGREPASGVAVRAEWLAGADLECRITLAGVKKPRCEAAVELRLPCAGGPLEVLAPGPDDRRTVDFTKACGYAFRGKGQPLSMPATVLYRADEDWGLTLFADFALPMRGFEVSFDDKLPTVAARRVHLRLEPGKPVTVSLLLFGHDGDWRPGLGHLVERYPDFFVVADRRVPQLHGTFMCSGGFKPDTEIVADQSLAEWKRQHVRTVEVHGTFPFYGRYLPLGEQWTTLVRRPVARTPRATRSAEAGR